MTTEEAVEAEKMLGLASSAVGSGHEELAASLTITSVLVLILGELREIKALLDTESEDNGE